MLAMGYPSKQVKVIALVYKQISQVGLPHHPGQLCNNFADVFRHA